MKNAILICSLLALTSCRNPFETNAYIERILGQQGLRTTTLERLYGYQDNTSQILCPQGSTYAFKSTDTKTNAIVLGVVCLEQNGSVGIAARN